MINYNNLKVVYMDDIHAIQDLYKKDILEYLNDCDIDPTPNNIEDAAQNIIDNDYSELLTSINTYDFKKDYDYIIIKYSLGLWYGRRDGVVKFKTLKEALQNGSYDYNIIYFKNNRETLIKESQHHDGCNTYKYYKVKNGKKYAIKYDELINIAI